jgi:23S rRNA pseudouridine1911/1915/1917 synthase
MTSSLPKTKELLVPALGKPKRLDKFLTQTFPETSRAYWNKNLTQTVRVDGKKVSKGLVLTGGEKISLSKLPSLDSEPLQANSKIPLNVLFEDPDLLAIDKPAGLPCHPLNLEETNTLVSAVIAKYPEQSKLEPFLEAGLIHRIDNDTSGIVLFARNKNSLEIFKELNRKGEINKYYLAIVEGTLTGRGKINFLIAHHPKNEQKMLVPIHEREAKRSKAREAETEYRTIKAGKQFSLVLLKIHKGARHQIRVHLATLGHPIVGDTLYGSKETAPRYLLHARKIQFTSPYTHKKIMITCPLPKDFIQKMKQEF